MDQIKDYFLRGVNIVRRDCNEPPLREIAAYYLLFSVIIYCIIGVQFSLFQLYSTVYALVGAFELLLLNFMTWAFFNLLPAPRTDNQVAIYGLVSTMLEIKLDMDLIRAMPTATLTPFLCTLLVCHMYVALTRLGITCFDWITTNRPSN